MGSLADFAARVNGLAALQPTNCSSRRPFVAPGARGSKRRAADFGTRNRPSLHVEATPTVQGVPPAEDTAQSAAGDGSRNGNGAHEELVFAPEDYQLPPGVPSTIDREAPVSPADVFRCPGCSEAACQGAGGCERMQWRHSQAGYLRKILSSRVYDVAIETPLEVAPRLSEQTGNTVLLKREDMQSVFSFKLRGAFNKLASLTPEQRERGVVCSSAGNHAQGVALGAKTLGCKAIICMPVVSPEIKVKAVQRLGATVELVGETYTETQAYAQEKAAREGLVFIPPYDDPYIIAGQGTAGAEILRQLSSQQRDSLDAIFVAIGGGGLAAGIAAYAKQLMPHVKVFGVEPTGANCMALSLAKGKRVSLSKVDAFADGVAVKTVGAETFRLCRELLDGVLLVDNRAISGAIEAVFNDKRSILEPAGAVAVAGATQYLEHHNIKGKAVVAVTSGANMNFDRLRLVADLAAVGARQEAIFATSLPERPGSFQRFIDVALADTDLQITEFKYRYSAEENAHVLWGASVKSAAAAEELVARLNASGLVTRDASNIEAVQVHLRHLVGGRARSYMGSLPNERIMQVDFPERPGALRSFLGVFVPTWNFTLFHYRKSGNRSTSILLGIQVPSETERDFAAAQELLGEEFSFSELSTDAKKVFDMFIS